MIVAFVQTQRHVDIRSVDRLFEQPGAQAVFEKAVRLALVDQEFRETGAVFDQRAGIVLPPGRAVGA